MPGHSTRRAARLLEKQRHFFKVDAIEQSPKLLGGCTRHHWPPEAASKVPMACRNTSRSPSPSTQKVEDSGRSNVQCTKH